MEITLGILKVIRWSYSFLIEGIKYITIWRFEWFNCEANFIRPRRGESIHYAKFEEVTALACNVSENRCNFIWNEPFNLTNEVILNEFRKEAIKSVQLSKRSIHQGTCNEFSAWKHSTLSHDRIVQRIAKTTANAIRCEIQRRGTSIKIK